ncbi:MAG: hypothetical protein K2H13_03510 [Eubacterium sp.]|nr:hypothetical protein [Eubacterium sp.]MDE6155162.1 hypothetical protein [Eubacterium sp.]
MKDKFIKIISPIQLAIVGILDIAVIAYLIFAIAKLIHNPKASIIFFAAGVAVALIVAVLVTKEVLTNGVIFHDDELEFTGLDSDNIFDYNDIVKVETEKDDKPSFVKNFVDRQSKIILTLKNEKVITINIGITTKTTLEKISDEIKSRIPELPQDEIVNNKPKSDE